MPSVIEKLKKERDAFLAVLFQNFTDPNAVFLQLKEVECKYFKQIQNVVFQWYIKSQGLLPFPENVEDFEEFELQQDDCGEGLKYYNFNYVKTVWISCDKVAKLVISAVAVPVEPIPIDPPIFYRWVIFNAKVYNCIQVCNCHIDKKFVDKCPPEEDDLAPRKYVKFHEWLLRPRCFTKSFLKGKNCGENCCSGGCKH